MWPHTMPCAFSFPLDGYPFRRAFLGIPVQKQSIPSITLGTHNCFFPTEDCVHFLNNGIAENGHISGPLGEQGSEEIFYQASL